jgi:hypothetical protein
MLIRFANFSENSSYHQNSIVYEVQDSVRPSTHESRSFFGESRLSSFGFYP